MIFKLKKRCGRPEILGSLRNDDGYGYDNATSNFIVALELFSNECRKTKIKVITLATQKGRRQSSKPIKTQSNYT